METGDRSCSTLQTLRIGPLRLFLIDQSDRGPTRRIVEAAVDAERRQRSSSVELEVVSRSKAVKGLAGRGASDVVLVSVGESQLSSSPQGNLSRTACESLAVAQTLAGQVSGPVHLLRHTDAAALSGLEVTAVLLAGSAGVIDDRLLMSDGVLRGLLDHQFEDARSRSMLLIGRSAGATRVLVEMLKMWSEELECYGTLDAACWRAAMALAQLDELRPLRGPGDRFSFVKLAQALNLRSADTTFQLTENDLRRVLSDLADLWLPDPEDKPERLHLPNYAKANGFPSSQPAVSGIEDHELPKRLYEIAKQLVLVDRGVKDDEVPTVVVRVPRRQSTQRRRK